jgi:hypothetical protein
MITLNSYLESIRSEVKKEKGRKESKVEKVVYDYVREEIEKGSFVTIKDIVSYLNKSKNYSSYVRVLVTKSERLSFEKVNGVNVIVLSEMK